MIMTFRRVTKYLEVYQHDYPTYLLGLVAPLLIAVMSACGGGGSSTSAPLPPPQNPNFSLSLNPSSQSLDTGSSQNISLSASAIDGFSSQINVAVSGLASGVTVSPDTFSLTPGNSQQVTVSAASNATTGSATVTFTGTSGSLTHNASLNLTVQAASSSAPGRTRYLRTDAVTPYFAWVNPHWIIYNSPTSRFFFTDPFSQHVFVIDSVSQKLVGAIVVPGAFGIDDTPDHQTLYVGTMNGDVYSIDPVSMTVKRRYIASQIGPAGFKANTALVLADGRLALLGVQGGIASVDGSTSFAFWDPDDNSLTLYGNTGLVPGNEFPCGVFLGNIAGFARTVDRTQIIIGSIDSDGTLCEINASTGTAIHVTGPSFGLYRLTTSPDGKYIILPNYPDGIAFYDAHTLAKVAQFSVRGDISSNAGFVVSADSKTLFVPTDSIVYAYDMTTHQQVGWFPNTYLTASASGFAVGPINGPNLQAVDNTGLLAGPMEEGIGFVDSTKMQTGPVGTAFTNAYLKPAAGSISGGTAVQWGGQVIGNNQGPVYFGNKKATSISNTNGIVTATTPPGNPGPVNVYSFARDGGMQIVPDGFSYGPTILQVTPNMATSEGGGASIIFGYGLLPLDATTVPSDVKVKIGGKTATIVGFSTNAYGLLSPPFQLQALTYTIPNATPGNTDVSVSNNTGTATSPNAFTYLPTVQRFSLPGAALVQGIYDSHRNLYYFTDTHKIQVFSRPLGQWLSPINVPAPSGSVQKLWGIALSPNGSKLVVSDASAGVIYLVDPANPASIKTLPIDTQGGIGNPCGVAVSDSGTVYYASFVQGVTGARGFFKLNTSTGKSISYDLAGPGLGVNDVYLRVAISSDNSRVFFNNLGYVFNVDTATDTMFSSSADATCCYGNYELTLSSNQTRFSATSYLYDSDLNAESFLGFNDRETLFLSYVYGAKLSPDGRLLFQPSPNGLDVIDGRLGMLLQRISFPFAVSANYDALVADGRDNVLIAITGANGDGIAVVDLTSIGEPPPLNYNSELTSGVNWIGRMRAPQGKEVEPREEQAEGKNKRPRPKAIPHVTKSFISHANIN